MQVEVAGVTVGMTRGYLERQNIWLGKHDSETAYTVTRFPNQIHGFLWQVICFTAEGYGIR